MGIGEVLVTDIGKGKAAFSVVWPRKRVCAKRLFSSDTATLYFHNQDFHHAPFMNFDVSYDYLLQSVSNAINQFQPNFGDSQHPDAEGSQRLTITRAGIESRNISFT
jgi:hypothetical protein